MESSLDAGHVVAFVLGAVAMFFILRLTRPGATSAAPATITTPSAGRRSVSARVESLAREGQVIEAIKLHREETGCGLKEAKDDIDALRVRP